MTAVIELESVSRTYPGPPEVYALRPCSLTVQAGEYVTVVGPSGSGKSTLLNILGLLDRPTEGRYLLDGSETRTLSEAERTALRAHSIAFVFQSFHLLMNRPALENVMLAQLYRGIPTKQRRNIAQQTLERVGLAARSSALPSTMSGGERQRVAIARALAMSPRVLLCDEPTGNLDSGTADAVLGLIDELHHDGLTVLMITHDAQVAARGNRTVRIRDGSMEEVAG